MRNPATAAIREISGPWQEVRPQDDRSTLRFDLGFDLSYSLPLPTGSVTGDGRTINLSSGGALFQTAGQIVKDAEIHLSIEWPVKLEDGVPLRLFLVGQVLRCEHGCTAVKILVYQFRTAQRGSEPNGVGRWYWGRRLRTKSTNHGGKGAD